jgi:hypothetical protein
VSGAELRGELLWKAQKLKSVLEGLIAFSYCEAPTSLLEPVGL